MKGVLLLKPDEPEKIYDGYRYSPHTHGCGISA